MKKKILAFSVLLFVLIPFVIAADAYEPYAHYIVGHVDSATDFSVSVFENVLPFDLDSPDVAYNPNYATQIRGLRIGQYTLLSNTNQFEFFVAHTPLVLRGSGDENDDAPLTQIDYRLYMIADFNNSYYRSCLSDMSASNTDTATNKIDVLGSDSHIWSSGSRAGMCSIVNQGLYVSLEDDTSGSTAETLADLKSGTYESTIYFLLKGV